VGAVSLACRAQAAHGSPNAHCAGLPVRGRSRSSGNPDAPLVTRAPSAVRPPHHDGLVAPRPCSFSLASLRFLRAQTFSRPRRAGLPSELGTRSWDFRMSRDEPSARHSPVGSIHGRVRRKSTPGKARGPGRRRSNRPRPAQASCSASALFEYGPKRKSLGMEGGPASGGTADTGSQLSPMKTNFSFSLTAAFARKDPSAAERKD
jgi:hypothetical protein